MLHEAARAAQTEPPHYPPPDPERHSRYTLAQQQVLELRVHGAARVAYLGGQAMRLRQRGLAVERIYNAVAALNWAFSEPELADGEVRRIAGQNA
jgi:hypothetical protein